MNTAFPIDFLIFWMVLWGSTLVFLWVKKKLCSPLSPRRNYQLGRLYFLLLSLPLLSLLPGISSFFHILDITGLKIAGTQSVSSFLSPHALLPETASAAGGQWLNDFALPFHSSPLLAFLSRYLLPGIWAGGSLLLLISVARDCVRLQGLGAHAQKLSFQDAPMVYHAWRSALYMVPMGRTPVLVSSPEVPTPLSFGILRPVVILPLDWDLFFTQEDLYYMFLHELSHLKQRDPLSNLFFRLFKCIYWFHPVVGRTLTKLQSEQEGACDQSVLDLLEEDSRRNYGRTLLNCAALLSKAKVSPMACSLCQEESSLKRRILQIAAYKKEKPSQKRKARIFFVLTIAGILVLSPVLCSLFVSAQTEKGESASSFYQEALVENQEFLSCFGDFQGAFVLYDTQKQEYQVSDLKAAQQRCAPQSTYKIYSALFALDQNLITPQDSLRMWDEREWPFEAWNQDQTLDTAMSGSVNWYFQALDSQGGRDALESYFHRISYGNEDISGPLSSYWMDSSLKISPLEQARLLGRLWDNPWGFRAQDVQAVKKSLLVEKARGCTLYGKTGTGNIDQANASGWFIGVLETPDNTYPFACLIQGSQEARGTKAAQIARDILRNYGL